MDVRARGSAVLAVLGWMFAGACVGAALGIFVGFAFVAMQDVGETREVTGESSGLVVLIFQFWGAVVGGLASGIAAVLWRASKRSNHDQPSLPPPPSAFK